jgi:hypothetical protein
MKGVAMSDREISYEITADNQGFVRAIERAAGVARQATETIKGDMEGVGEAFDPSPVDALQSSLESVDAGALSSMLERLNGVLANVQVAVSQVSDALEHQSGGALKATSEIASFAVGAKAAIDVFDRLSKPRSMMPGLADSLKSARQELGGLGLAAKGELAKVNLVSASTATSISSSVTAAFSAVRAGAVAALPAVGTLAIALSPIVLIAVAIEAAIKLCEIGFDAFVNGALQGGRLQKIADDLAKNANAAARFQEQLGQAQPMAQALAEILSQAGVKTDDYVAGTENLRVALNDNEAAFKVFGVATRDSSGHLRDQSAIAADTAQALRKLADDGSRAWQMNELGVKSLNELDAVAKATPEAIEAMNKHLAEYRALIGSDAVAATKRYEQALREYKAESDLTWRGVSNMIGQAVMPAFTDLLEWFKGGMPSLASITHRVMEVVMSAWYAMANSATWAKEMTLAAVGAIGDGFDALRGAVQDLGHGDFSSFFKRIEDAKKAGGARFEAANQAVLDQEKEFKARLAAYADAGTEAIDKIDGGANTNKRVHSDKKTATARDKQDPGRMPMWEAQLEEEKRTYMLQNDLREMSKAQELAYWDTIRESSTLTENERVALLKRTGALRVAILKDEGKTRAELSQEAVAEYERSLLSQLESDRAAADQALQLHQITDLEKLELDRQFADQQYQIQRAALDQRLALLEQDPNLDPAARLKMLDQIAALERKHQLDLQKIQNQVQVKNVSPQMNMFKSWEESFNSAATGILTRSTTLSNGLRQLSQKMFQSFVSEYLTKRAAAVAMATLKENALYQYLFGQQMAEQTAASTSTVIAKKAEAAEVIPAEAAVAAGGAAASVASIPIIGPALAAAAFAETMGMVMGGLAVASASGGYDIPAGVNPVVQTHAKEMILPAKYADVIRGMAEAGGSSGANGSGALSVSVHAVDSRDVVRSLTRGGALYKALSAGNRRFQKV